MGPSSWVSDLPVVSPPQLGGGLAVYELGPSVPRTWGWRHATLTPVPLPRSRGRAGEVP